MKSRRRLWAGGAIVFALSMIAGGAAGTFAAFSGTTSNGTNSFSAAASFCSGSTSTVNPDSDNYVDENSTGTNNGTLTTLSVQPNGSKRRRALVHFALPSIPQYCVLTAATLRLNLTAAAAGHSLEVYRAGASWTETGSTWANQPGKAGTAVTASSAVGWVTFNVLTHAKGLYQGSNYGFVVRDANDAAGSPNGTNTINSREAASNKPELVLTFGAGSSADTTSPVAMDVQAANHTGGIAGRPELSDTITYTFSESMSASSILSGWSGSSTNVVVRINNNASNDQIQIWNSSNTTQLNLGTVDSNGNITGSNITFGASGTASTMVMSGNTITVTLGTQSAAGSTGAAAFMVWTPSGSATDTAGNACETATGTESGTSDVDF